MYSVSFVTSAAFFNFESERILILEFYMCMRKYVSTYIAYFENLTCRELSLYSPLGHGDSRPYYAQSDLIAKGFHNSNPNLKLQYLIITEKKLTLHSVRNKSQQLCL